MKPTRDKIIVITGPTASGKTGLAVRIAKRFGGEVVSADSRHVYRGLDVASGKATKKEMSGIPHHLIDVADPRRTFSVERYRKLALRAVRDILRKGRLPIVCGGTGFYIQAVADGAVFPEVRPDRKLRAELAKKSAVELSAMLRRLDPARLASIDAKNPRRLVRAIEIAKALGKVPEPVRVALPYSVLKVGLQVPVRTLERNIERRTAERMRKGMIAEARHLRRQGLSLKRMRELGLEYRALADHLEGKSTKEELTARISLEDRRYAKRQMTWFRRDKEVRWFSPAETAKIEKEIGRFLSA